MFKNPRRVFILIILLTLLAGTINVPNNYPIKFQLGSWKIDRVINPPTVFGRSFTTKLGLDLSGGTHLVLDADMKDIAPQDRSSALASASEVIERRVNFFGVSEPIVQTAVSKERYRIIVELPGISHVDQAIALIGQTASLEFREFSDPNATISATTTYDQLYQMTKPVGLTGKDLSRAQTQFDTTTGEPQVAIAFTSEGGKTFADVTRRLVGQRLAIFLDRVMITDPVVKQEITDGQAIISGQFTVDEAKNLALQLNAGALPVPVSVVENRTIGATLGAASVAKSIDAGVVGLTIVALFMIAQYGWLGLIADTALLVYGLLTFAIFRFIPITLTLPGIAGFILSIGMAVDSNILIFERFKEEKRAGRPWRVAMELGFGKAWDSIRDANFTTLLTSAILYNPGNWDFLPSSGLVRGFAITLFIGVLASLFTGIVVTRTFIRVLYREK
ncbi:MAG: Protein-export membrane protein SecD [Microgenomates group bacterium GW2011_GWC1_49_7]|nr:MAG: Protein-export membrane protein SecD [Microgenomates group bacterium GW2011_GWC1_49_7]